MWVFRSILIWCLDRLVITCWCDILAVKEPQAVRTLDSTSTIMHKYMGGRGKRFSSSTWISYDCMFLNVYPGSCCIKSQTLKWPWMDFKFAPLPGWPFISGPSKDSQRNSLIHKNWHFLVRLRNDSIYIISAADFLVIAWLIGGPQSLTIHMKCRQSTLKAPVVRVSSRRIEVMQRGKSEKATATVSSWWTAQYKPTGGFLPLLWPWLSWNLRWYTCCLESTWELFEEVKAQGKVIRIRISAHLLTTSTRFLQFECFTKVT